MELILTDEEKAAASWMDWDDETIGKAVRAMASIWQGEDPNRILAHRAAAMFLCHGAMDVNAETTTLCLDGVTFRGEPIGNYRITIERGEAPFVDDAPPKATWDGEKLTQFSARIEGGMVAAPSLENPNAD